MRKKRSWARALAVVLLAALLPAEASAQWWNSSWKCRRKATVEPPPANAGLPGKEVGYAEFRTGGLAQKDGADVVVISRGKPVPHKVLHCGPGDLCKVAFEMEPGVTSYYIYYGNPSAKAGETKWEPQRGLLLETRKYVGGGCASWGQMQDSLARSKGQVLGVGYQPNVFLGFNPFGPSENYISVYTGWLHIKQQGNYGFATTSSDGSFLLINDQLVVQWAGYHRAIPEARFTKTLSLEPGLHKFAYYHLKAMDAAAAVAAWQPPWLNKYEVIPETAFPKAATAVLSDYEQKGEPADDFSVAHVSEIYMDSEAGTHVLVKMHFEHSTRVAGGLSAVFDWDFGDGNRGEGRIVDHVYLAPGVYAVKMIGRIGGDKRTVEHEVAVDRNWAKQLQPAEDKPEQYAAFIAKYDFAAMRSTDLVIAAKLFDTAQKPESAAAVCQLALKRNDLDEKTFYDTALMLGRLLKAAKAGTEKVVAAYREAEAKIANVKLKAQLSMAEGEELLAERGNDAAAMKEFQEVIGKYGAADDETRRKAHIGMGDVYKRKANYEKAREHYEKAQQMQLVDLPYKREAVRVGAFARAVESYLREGNLTDAENFLRTWQWEYPLERIEGPSTIYKARFHLAKGEPPRAAAELEEFAAANPKSNFAPEALMLAVECYRKMGQTEKAANALKTVMNDYKDSPLAAKAEEELKKGEKSAESPATGKEPSTPTSPRKPKRR